MDKKTRIDFICGLPRSGTTWMAEVMSEHSEVVSFGETQYWGKKYVKCKEKKYSIRDQKEIINNMWGRTLMKGKSHDIKSVMRENEEYLTRRRYTPKKYFEKIVEIILDLEGKKRAIEKTPHHIHYIDRIAKEFEKSRFLILVRDPYDFILSYKHQSDRREGAPKKSFEKVYHPLGASLSYRGYCNSVIDAKKKYPQRTLLVRQKEIKNSSKKLVKNVQKFLGVNAEKIRREKTNTSFPSRERPDLEEVEIFWMNKLAKKNIKEMGYRVKKTDTKVEDVVLSMLKIPIWLKNIYINISNRSNRPWSHISKWIRSEF
ncbi:sulfotransferase family protein [Salinibacter sp.]|uniref:sulfotransferase family protein n=1 Tax=Salinibacter sp. TaxID=2065818 RepID=UPI0021E7363A|nr:sulfotransferase [Salinibacter sp.]